MEKEKIIFVGIHNKADKLPLCSSTKSGKLIDRIIKRFPQTESVKTNLFNIDYFPSNLNEEHDLIIDWWFRLNPNPDDIIVLLGAVVHNKFLVKNHNVIKIAHPAYPKSHIKMDSYVENAVNLINKILTNKGE